MPRLEGPCRRGFLDVGYTCRECGEPVQPQSGVTGQCEDRGSGHCWVAWVMHDRGPSLAPVRTSLLLLALISCAPTPGTLLQQGPGHVVPGYQGQLVFLEHLRWLPSACPCWGLPPGLAKASSSPRSSDGLLLVEGTSADLCILKPYPFIKAKIRRTPRRAAPHVDPLSLRETTFLLWNLPCTLNVPFCGGLGKCGFVFLFLCRYFEGRGCVSVTFVTPGQGVWSNGRRGGSYLLGRLVPHLHLRSLSD